MNKKTDINESHWQALVLLLSEIAKDKGLSQSEIARRTGYKQQTINAFFACRYCPNLRTFLLIAQSLSVNFFFESKESKSELNVLLEKGMAELGRRPNKLPTN